MIIEEFLLISNLNQLPECNAGYSSLLFISTNIYNVDILKKYIGIGIFFSYSLQPHCAMLIACLIDQNGVLVTTSDQIVYWNDSNETSWSNIDMIISRKSIFNLKGMRDFTNYSQLYKYVMNGYDDWKSLLKLCNYFRLPSVSLKSKRYVLSEAYNNINRFSLLSYLIYIFYSFILKFRKLTIIINELLFLFLKKFLFETLQLKLMVKYVK